MSAADALILIEHRDLGIQPIFVDGNTNYSLLENEHTCNSFCKFYGVPTEIFGREDKPSGSLRQLSPLASDSRAREFPSRIAQHPEGEQQNSGKVIEIEQTPKCGPTTYNLYYKK